jgi:hypothetical protein
VADDIVARLKAVVVDQFYGEDQLTITEAVEEIERLRLGMAELQQRIHHLNEDLLRVRR